MSKKRQAKATKTPTPPKADPAAKRRAKRLYDKLLDAYPEAQTSLVYRNAYELLTAAMLSAQCTDKLVNTVTPKLFERFGDPASMARASEDDLQSMIKSVNFYRNKAKALRGCAQAIVNDHDGEVPGTMEELIALPGVARKTANVVLNNGYGKSVGIVVDTHVMRVSKRLGLTEHTDAKKVELDLMSLFPRSKWPLLAHLMIDHGRLVCKARYARCEACPLGRMCCRVDRDGEPGGQNG